MRLSEAMMLGSVTCKMTPLNINTCALGAALNALGVPQEGEASYRRYDELKNLYPWLGKAGYVGPYGEDATGLEAIYRRFDYDVCYGHMTFEQLVDFVRSIEPPEETVALPEVEVTELVCK